jgi:hypothetical protein
VNYWDAKGAICDLTDFRNAYVEWANGYYGGGRDVPAQVRTKLVKLAPVMQTRLDALGSDAGLWELRDAPALGGRRQYAHLAQLILSPELADTYRISPHAIIDTIESAIGAYEAALPELRRKLHNPAYWLGLAFRFFLRIPFAFLEGAGLDVRPLERSPVGHVFKLGWLLTALSVVADLAGLGVLDYLRRLLDSLF